MSYSTQQKNVIKCNIFTKRLNRVQPPLVSCGCLDGMRAEDGKLHSHLEWPKYVCWALLKTSSLADAVSHYMNYELFFNYSIGLVQQQEQYL